MSQSDPSQPDTSSANTPATEDTAKPTASKKESGDKDTSSVAGSSASGSIEEHLRDIDWRPEHENILIDWADKAMCYRWLHDQANTKFATKNTWFTIPVIILSTITGTANFAQERFGEEYKDMAVMIVGALNLFAGILTTIKQFLNISELNEAHRVSSISWDKFYRNIKVELTKHPNQRFPVGQMLKIQKEEFDRLMEISPQIPASVSAKFKAVFHSEPEFDDIHKPDICGTLIPTDHFRYKESEEEREERERIRAMELANRDTGKENINKKKFEVVKEFYKDFKQMKSREPFIDEIMSNLNDKVDLTENEIRGFLRQLTNSDGSFGDSVV
jgi:hypothetical protein